MESTKRSCMFILRVEGAEIDDLLLTNLKNGSIICVFIVRDGYRVK